jgi:drug/metabolite transporter (DMT)-like permease
MYLALLIAGGIVAHQLESMTVKRYGDKKGKGGMFFNAFLCLFAVLFYVFSDLKGLHFCKEIWIWGIFNSFMYAAGFYSMYVALKEGSFGLTRLISSFTGIISTVYGIAVLGDLDNYGVIKKIFTISSIILVFLSVFLMRFQKRNPGEEKKGFSAKWLIGVIVTVASNGVIGILQKEQQLAFSVNGINELKNEYLIITFVGSALWLFVLGFIYERESFVPTVKTGLTYGAVAGLCNGANNLLGLITIQYFDLSFITPFKTGISMIVTFLVSILFYKEKFSLRQYLAVAIGIAAIVLMSVKI